VCGSGFVAREEWDEGSDMPQLGQQEEDAVEDAEESVVEERLAGRVIVMVFDIPTALCGV
jgi:hypothetical protein